MSFTNDSNSKRIDGFNNSMATLNSQFASQKTSLNNWQDAVLKNQKESIEKIDVLHLDIQGSELPLLKQLVKSGKINDIDMIMVATHSREADLFIVELVNSTHFEVSNYHKWYGEDDGWFVLKNGKVS